MTIQDKSKHDASYMRYFRIIEGGNNVLATFWGGAPTYWFEINVDGDAEQQIVYFPNGNVLSYDMFLRQDEYDSLQEMVIDGDEDFWLPYTITRGSFECAWEICSAMNREPTQREKLVMPSLRYPKSIEPGDEIPF